MDPVQSSKNFGRGDSRSSCVDVDDKHLTSAPARATSYGMDVPVNYLAVLVAAVANMILGSLWYGKFFAKPWIAMSGITPQQMEEAKSKGMGKSYALAFVGSLLMSYILSHVLTFATDYLGSSGVSAGIMTGFWNWLGFVAPVMLGSVLWENKPWKLWMINSGYYLASLVMMGIILAVWM